MAAANRADLLATDAASGVFGHPFCLVDFDPSHLDELHTLARTVRLAARPNVESAIAISGSSAQGKVQLFPGDVDFFERVNIKAETPAAAQGILRRALRETALRSLTEPGIILVEVNFGVYPGDVIERGIRRRCGDPITWSPEDVLNGSVEVVNEHGRPLKLYWNDVQAGLGWTYAEWIVADAASRRIVQTSNMLDVTWESASGDITSLDGAIDPCFQEIYLDHETRPIVEKLVRRQGTGAMRRYVNAMRSQVSLYTRQTPSFCKASKRLYNLFRLTGEPEAAAYVRALFDDPGARLYPIPGLLGAIATAVGSPGKIPTDLLLRQLDEIIDSVPDASMSSDLAASFAQLKRLRALISADLPLLCDWPIQLQEIRRRCEDAVSEYFRMRLLAHSRIATIIEALE